MIDAYNNLRQKYIIQGYEQAYQYIQALQQQNIYHQIVLTNFYCYITIQSQFKVQQVLDILNSCLQIQNKQEQQNKEAIRALTLYHIASVHFKTENYQECLQKCRLIIQEFIGLYHSLDKRLQRSQNEQNMRQDLQQILYYVFLMMGFVSKQQNNMETSSIYADAGKRILRDRKDVLSLTTKTGLQSTPTKFSEPPESIDGQSRNFTKMKSVSSFESKIGLNQRSTNCYSHKKAYARSETCKI